MRLLYKDIAPDGELNGNGSIKGGWIFEKMDYAALTIASEDFIHTMPGVAAVTNNAEIKYISSVFPHEYIEIWGEYSYISPGKFDIDLEFRQRYRKSSEWIVSAKGTFSFSLIDAETRKIVRIPKEVVNEIKG